MINIIQIIDIIGVSGPIILGISSLVLLYNKSNLFSVYIIGFIINSLLNILLKGIIKQPRPSEDIHVFNIKLMSGKRIGYDKFGMPSGHAQSVFYSTFFILFALKNNIITFFYFIISFLTIYQRIKYLNHSIYIIYYLTNQKYSDLIHIPIYLQIFVAPFLSIYSKYDCQYEE